jgi:ABC-type transport system involved in multi-copper enzyme maturation permease subunit
VLEAGRISLLLAKPLTRTRLLLGRYLGNVCVVALNHIYLICSVWLILGIKTHIWEPRFLLAIPISIFIFAVLLCVVVLIGVVSESAALSVMVAVALMLISTILAQRQIVVRLLSSQWSRDLWLAFYWIIPKVFDLGSAMKQLILYDRQANWAMPVWTSALFGIVVLSTAVYAFQKRDF